MNENTNYENVIKQTAVKKKSGLMNIRKTYPAYIILILFIAAGFVVKHFVKESVESNTRIEFDKAVNSITTRLSNHLERHEQVLQSMHGLYGENIEVVRDYFELYGAVPAKTYTSILSLSYVPYVRGEDWENYHFSARSQGYFYYTLTPAGTREFYHPILHSVLYENNASRIGFDYATVPQVLQAIEKARDGNIETATNVLPLRDGIPAISIIKPIYLFGATPDNIGSRREEFQASLVLEIGVDEFFKTGLRGSDGNFFPTDSTVVYDYYEKDNPQSIIFKSKNYDLLESGYLPMFEEEIEFIIADKIFVGRFRSIPDFGGKFQAMIPLLSLIGSLITSLIFFAFIVSVITSRARAEDLAERMTRSQRRILEATKDIIGVMDFTGKWKSVNPAVEPILGYSSDDFLKLAFDSLFADNKELEDFKRILAVSENEKTEKIDLRLKTSQNEEVWVNWSFTMSKTDALVYAIGRDVTLEKHAEHEAEIKRKQIELAEQFALEASHSKSFFMIKLSHQLRNSLTGIIGYLQLLSGKFYNSEEEQMEYIKYAEDSSEEIFTFVSDIVDATIGQGESSLDSFTTVKVEPTLRKVLDEFCKDTKKTNISIDIDTSGTEPSALVSPLLLEKSLYNALEALIADMDGVDLQAVVQENTYESATEIQILGSGNSQIAELIKLYQNNSANIIDILKYDDNDVISNLAKSASIIRRMNGTMSVDTFGGNEGNIITITLPLVKRNM